MDRKTIKEGFELCANGEPCMGDKYITCPFSPRNNSEQNCGVTMAKYVLALLKEQEAVKPVITPWRVSEDGEVEIAKRECGKCGWQFFTEKPNYCENCGCPVKWE